MCSESSPNPDNVVGQMESEITEVYCNFDAFSGPSPGNDGSVSQS